MVLSLQVANALSLAATSLSGLLEVNLLSAAEVVPLSKSQTASICDFTNGKKIHSKTAHLDRLFLSGCCYCAF